MESKFNPVNAPAGAAMNNKPATPAEKNQKKAGMSTGAKVGIGVAAGAAATFGATAAVNSLADDIVIEGAEGILDDASSTAEVLTTEPEVYTPTANHTMGGDDVISTAEIDNEVVIVNPNDVRMDGDDIVIEPNNDDFVYDDNMPSNEMNYESPLAYDGDPNSVMLEEPEDLYSYDDGGDMNCDPTDDIII